MAGGAQQTGYRWAVYSAIYASYIASYGAAAALAGPGDVYDSGIVYGPALQAQCPWLDLSQHVLLVEVVQSGGQTATAYEIVTPNPLVVPTAPTIVAYPSPADQAPEVVVTVAAGGTVKIGDMQRSQDDGTTWAPVLGAAGAAVGPLADYRMCPGVDVIYRGCTQTADGTARSAWATTQPVRVTPAVSWFSDPTVPASAVPALVTDISLTLPVSQAAYKQLGVRLSTVITDLLGSDAGTVTVVFFDDASYLAFRALRDTCRSVLFQPAGTDEQWYLSLGTVPVTYLDAVTRQLVLPATEVAAPPVVVPL